MMICTRHGAWAQRRLAMAKKYVLKMEIPEQRLVDLFISACEGGSNYWCGAVTTLNDLVLKVVESTGGAE